MKKFIVSMLLLLPLGLFAQDMKIAIVNTNEIFTVMPEVSAMEDAIAKLAKEYENELKSMEEEYTRKYTDYVAQADSLTENIKQLRMQEIQELHSRIENFYTMANETRNKTQQELFTPIREKVMKAINEVSEENGYAYVIDPQALLFVGKSAIDATDKVKAKMGLK